MTFNKGNKVAILIDGKIAEVFTNKLTKPLCETLMTRYVILQKGYAEGSFKLMKM